MNRLWLSRVRGRGGGGRPEDQRRGRDWEPVSEPACAPHPRGRGSHGRAPSYQPPQPPRVSMVTPSFLLVSSGRTESGGG